ncbi:MAG TPA: efflux transporter outer membrane subunit [Albitalea sp.]|nr:efflux transporter outer membrane subunit [Albitalea sp.]
MTDHVRAGPLLLQAMRVVAMGAALSAALAGCASHPAAPEPTGALAPAQWQAPLPHQGSVTDLARWWQQFNDPLLSQLIASAEGVSPTLASAQSRIAQARAARTASGAALLPAVNANASVVRGRQDFVTPLGTLASAGLQASWELDLFGGGRAARDAAQARLEGAEAGWHEARVSVAAEVANNYVALRACEAQRVQTEADAASRAETARLTALTAQAGFQSPANEALSRASAAQGRAQLAAQRAQCDLQVKALVALTGIAEPALRTSLAGGTSNLPQPQQIAIGSVPAESLNQRPDLYSAARAVEAASADVANARAQRLPRVTLAGSVGRARFDGSGFVATGNVWSLGPIAVTLPVFDAGQRAANVDAARARYDEAAALYRARLRGAVREVEEALVQLQSTAERNEDARIAADGFDASYRATEARFRGGLASLFELEDARRSALQAHSTLIDLQRERVAAWITLYRALGGGWQPGAAQSAQAAVSALTN